MYVKITSAEPFTRTGFTALIPMPDEISNHQPMLPEDFFYITDRGLHEYTRLIGFNPANRQEVPHGATVLNVGGGTFQQFERNLHAVRPDVTMWVIDSSLTHPTVYRASPGREPTKLTDEERRIRRQFISGLSRGPNPLSLSISADAATLPFANQCFDIVLDVYGAAHYIQNPESLTKYMSEVARVLRPGGIWYVASMKTLPWSIVEPQLSLNFTLTLIKTMKGNRFSLKAVKKSEA